ATGGIAARRGESGDIRIGTGERGCAQVEARRETLDHAPHDSLRVAGVDLALDRPRKLAEWPLGGNTWVMLTKASSCWSIRPSRDGSLRRVTQHWPL